MTAEEQQNEAQFNNLSNNIIGKTQWGQFYGIMRGAASMGEGLVPHKICLDKDGAEIKVYSTKANKLLAAFMKPTHEYTQKYLAQKKYGEALLSVLGVYGQLKSVQEQEATKCITVTPSTILQQQAKQDQLNSARKKQETDTANAAIVVILIILIVIAIRIKMHNTKTK